MAKEKANKIEKISSKFEDASFYQMMRYADCWDWILLILSFFLNIVFGIITPMASIVFRGLVDVLTKGQSDYDEGKFDVDKFSSDLIPYIWGYAGLGVASFVLNILAFGASFTVVEKQVHKIRKRFFYAILNQDMEWFDKNEVGALTQKMSSSIDKIKEGVSDKLAIVVQSIACMISGIVIGAAMSWQLTLVMLVVSPFVVASLYGSARAMSKFTRKEIGAYSVAGAIAEEVISGIRTVMAFNAQIFESERYHKCLKAAEKMGVKKAFITAIFSGVFFVIQYGSMGIAFAYGAWLVVQGVMTPGVVFAVFWCVLIGAFRLGGAVPQIGSIVSAKVAAGEIFSIIDRAKPDCASVAGVQLPNVVGNIEFKNVHFRYPTRPEVKILDDLSFSVKNGQTVALVGHSGCGKSTSIDLLMRYYEAEKGAITLDGTPVEKLNIEWLRSIIGVVSQEPVLFAGTVEENLKLGRDNVTEGEMIKACVIANANEFIVKLPNGYQTLIGDGGVKLSGGQKQRLAIARTVLRNPKILLLDEATSALDSESEQLVQKALDRSSEGRTNIVIAHRLSTIRNADNIIVLDHGQIMEQGTHDELMALNGHYRHLIEAQSMTAKPKEFIEDVDLAPEDMIRGTPDSDLPSPSEERIKRASERLSRSLSSVKVIPTQDSVEIEDAMEELESEGAQQASIMDILRFAKPEIKKFIVVGMICMFICGMNAPAFAILYGRIFNSLSALNHDSDWSSSIGDSVGFIILGIVTGIANFGMGTLFGTAGEKVAVRLRLGVYNNILRQDASYFDKARHSTGKLTSRLDTDANAVKAAIDQRLAQVLQGLVSLIGGIVIAFYFSWKMAPIGIITAVVLVILQLSVTNYLKRRGTKDAQIAEEAARIATESIVNVRTVQALTRQKYMFDTFAEASRKPHRRAIIRGFWEALNYALSNGFVNINFAIAYAFGLALIRGGHTTPFLVFQVIESLNMASLTIIWAASYLPEYLRARISAGLIFTMMAQKPKIDGFSEGGQKSPIQGNIEIKDVHFAYPNGKRSMILNGISVSVPSGKTVALVGPSGCGKSTLIQLMERYYDVLSGSLNIDGVDIRQYNLKHVRNNMSIVGQEPVLFNLSIRDNIAYGLDDVTDDEIIEAANLANIHSFVVGLPQKYDTLVGGKGTQLSGGQKQRISIARAMIRQPKILLLDEATSALDTESEKMVQEALEKARYNRTCLVIAHRLSTIQHADLIVVIREGRVLESGNHQQLMIRKGLYYRLVEKQKLH